MNASGPLKEELRAIDLITDNVAQAITWARNPEARLQASDVLPRQVVALEALVAAISQQAIALNSEGQEAVEALVKASEKLGEVVRAHLAEPAESEH